MTKFDKRYRVIFIISLAVCFSSSETLPYILPLASVFVFSLYSYKSLMRTFLLITIFLVWALLGIFFGKLSGSGFVYQNVPLVFITYSALYILVTVPSTSLSPTLYFKLSRILFLVLLVEAIIGYVQIGVLFSQRGFLGPAAGDVVEGTIDLAFKNATGFETKIFAMNISLSLLLLLPYLMRHIKSKLYTYMIIIFIGGSFLLATVTHLILSFVLALLLAGLLTSLSRVNIKKILTLAAIIFTVLFSLSIISPTNYRQIEKQATKALDNPKVLVINRLINSLEKYPQLVFIGIGPGQGMSRASLIATGDFLGGAAKIPLIKPTTTTLYETDYVDLYEQNKSRSSVQKPYSSWIALFSESGITGMLIILSILTYFLLVPNSEKKHNPGMQIAIFVFKTSLLYLFISGMWEFYWEVPQSILVGILMIKALHSNVKQSTSKNNEIEQVPKKTTAHIL